MVPLDPQSYGSSVTQPDWKHYGSSRTELRQILEHTSGFREKAEAETSVLLIVLAVKANHNKKI